MTEYAKIVVMGSPITKSNFKMHNHNGRAILPDNSGTKHDRFALYEEKIAVETQIQNPGIVLRESLIAVLRVYYKSDKRHPDTNNITKSIFDGVEKSGLIINDAQIRRIIIEEYYDKVEPRFELELFAESVFRMSYQVRRHDQSEEPILYEPPANRKNTGLPGKGGYSEADMKKIESALEKKNGTSLPVPKPAPKITKTQGLLCSICSKAAAPGSFIKADGGKTIICKRCFKKLY